MPYYATLTCLLFRHAALLRFTYIVMFTRAIIRRRQDAAARLLLRLPDARCQPLR